MSSIIWTADELLSESSSQEGEAWRLTELQSMNSTSKLVDTLDEQDLLEAEIDASKPTYMEGTEHLDFLLSTPFRYSPTHDHASRFRRKGERGAFYASKEVETALAEKAFHTLRFFADSPDTKLSPNPISKTAICVAFKTDQSIDLSSNFFDNIRANIDDVSDYTVCQEIAELCRGADIEVVISQSARCPRRGENITILSPKAFVDTKPKDSQTWDLNFKSDLVIANRAFPKTQIEFRYEDWANDNRVANYIKTIAER